MNKLLLSLATLLVACVTTHTALAQEVKGDALAGAKKISMCMGCHGILGYHASFPEVHRVPKISGQGAKYIASALAAYKKGDRKHPTMRGIADSLTEQDIADLAEFYGSNGVDFNAPVLGKAPAGSAKAMELVARAGCTSCHGESFSKPLDPSYPRIAGQHPDYLYVALKAYKTTDKELIGRNQPIMGGIAKQFSNDELRILADYVGSLPGELKTVQQSRFR
ncbi:MAG: c-type cytochrome [Burkholderiales bacterium]